jgi:hypothetical protein
MKMFEVEVALNGDAVWISQDDGNGGTAIVALHPDQIDLVCQWLKQAASASADSGQETHGLPMGYSEKS